MDFFEHQDFARKRSGRLVAMFALAVLGVTLGVYAIVVLVWGGTRFYHMAQGPGPYKSFGDYVWPVALNPKVMLLAGGGTVLFIVGCSLWKMYQLRGGGESIAVELGGRKINSATTDASERRLLNVVEEMAIASGIPMPGVYLLESERAVNAFAAGFGTDDAVIGITRGAMELLSRDELQGVVAHEFSHILNGDMKLNLRLMGWVHGILAVALLGKVMLRAMIESSRYSSHRRSDRKGSPLPALALAVLLIAVGSIGLFFAKLIKAAVSRQREFLADAAAVQFTRNPDGIGGALKKIGGLSSGSKLRSGMAEEASHMFFAQGVTLWGFTAELMGGLTSTHPPLVERVQRIEPSFDGNFPKVKLPEKVEETQKADDAEVRAQRMRAVIGGAAAVVVATETAAMQGKAKLLSQEAQTPLIAEIGKPSAAHIEYAKQLLAALPARLNDAVHELQGAFAAVLVLLLDEHDDVRAKQMAHLQGALEPEMYKEVEALAPLMLRTPAASRIPLLDIALPALRELSPQQYELLIKSVDQLIKADGRVELFEWMLRRALISHLAPHFQKVKKSHARIYNVRGVKDECAVLLSALVGVSESDDASKRMAYGRGMQMLGLNEPMKQSGDANLSAVEQSLKKLDELSLREKKKLLHACATCVGSDRSVDLREAELLRVVADALECPMPPLLPGQQLV